MPPEGIIQLPTRNLRPHDRIVTAPSKGLPKGAEVRLVTDPEGNPFPTSPTSQFLYVFCDHGEAAAFDVGEVWEVERRGELDDCRACFLYEAARNFDHE